MSGGISFWGRWEQTILLKGEPSTYRVFQDPKWGQRPSWRLRKTSAAKFRGRKRGLIPRHLLGQLCWRVSNSPLLRLAMASGSGTDVGPSSFLSGGNVKLWVCWWQHWNVQNSCFCGDEHTKLPRSKTSQALMTLTNEFVETRCLTALMITHHMEDALKYGNRWLSWRRNIAKTSN